MKFLYKLSVILLGISVALIILPIIIALLFPNSTFMQVGFIFPMLGIIMALLTGLFVIIVSLIDWFINKKF
ncbi:hypothetical protein CI088_01490 [Enterococcus plantarum]|uniref:Uncharacterized protein n=1 Tax=Enterococcus plantarum TaxID=1077675 RepID=A0A2W3ZCN9_9ENTE|nr:hypothetical protein CI088_01490 [Enterococcus plantarum]